MVRYKLIKWLIYKLIPKSYDCIIFGKDNLTITKIINYEFNISNNVTKDSFNNFKIDPKKKFSITPDPENTLFIMH